MTPSLPSILTAALALLTAGTGRAQQFEARMRAPTPVVSLAAANAGIALDIDQTAGIDVLLKSGSALISDGNLGFDWSPPGARIPTIGGIPTPFAFAADVTGDGVSDLVNLSITFALVSEVHVSTGSPGGFWAPRALVGTTTGFTVPLLLQDVDGDTFPDLLYRRVNPTHSIGLLRNQGNGTFVDVSASSLPPLQIASTFFEGVALADATGDGLPELFVRSNGVIELLVNTGGVFTPVVSGLPAAAALQALYVADADADGDADLLIATAAGAPLQLWLGAGNGTFAAAAATLPAAGTGHAFADLDGDQRADLLLIESTPLGQQLLALRNSPGLQFQPVSSARVDTVTNLGEPVLADLEPDGDLDAIVGGTLFFLHDGNLGLAALTRQPIVETANEDTVVAGDIDGDGFVDLVVGDTLHLNQGDGYFTQVGVVLPAGAKARALEDLDNDGDLDLVWTRATTAVTDAGVMANTLGVLTNQTTFAAGVLGGRVDVGDFDGDGLPDLLSQSNAVLRNQGGLAFTTAATLPPGHRPLSLADFDNDGQVDIVTTLGSATTLWRNTGGFTFQALPTPLPGNLSAGVAGDFDSDGLLDLGIAYRANVGTTTMTVFEVWYQRPSAWVVGPTQTDGAESLVALAAGDLDDDGDLDLVGQRVWTNLGGGQFANLNSGVYYASALAVADLDGDRDLDIVRAANVSSRRPYMFVNRGIDLDADRLPVLGYTCEIAMSSRAGQGIAGDLVVTALALTRIAPVNVPGLGLLHVDPQSIVLALAGLTGADGRCSFPFALPATPALAGVDVYWQGGAVGAQGLRLSNLLIDRLLP